MGCGSAQCSSAEAPLVEALTVSSGTPRVAIAGLARERHYLGCREVR